MADAGDIIAGRFRLDAVLGQGGLGVVWGATQLGTGAAVAIKLLKHNDENARRRFATEAQALRRLKHPGCVAIFEFGEMEDGSPYLVTELLHGQPLNHRPVGPLPIADVLGIANEVAAAVRYAHSQGVTHRDLKPANVFLTDTGLKVLDFGLAKLARDDGPALTATGMMYGTPHYISPEQVRDTRSAGPATDQYALGIILFELISGRLPFQGTSLLQICMAHLNEPPPRLARSDCPESLRAVVFRLMQKEPVDRFPNFDAVVAALAAVEVPPTTDMSALRPRLRDSAPQEASPTTIPFGEGNEDPDLRLPIVLAAIIVVLLGVVGWLLVKRQQIRSQPPPPVVLPSAPPQPAPPPELQPPADPAQVSLPPVQSMPARPTPGCGRKPSDALVELTVDAGRGPRDVWVQLPEDYEPNTPAPAIALFTYRRRPVNEYARRAHAEIAAARAGFALIGLEAVDRDFDPPTTDVDFLKGWEDEAPPHKTPWEEPDDVEFVHLAIEGVGRRVCLDANRIVAMGHAEGAGVLQRLSCDDDFPFAALVVTGWSLEPTGGCRMTRPVPTLRVNGVDDSFVPFDGGAGCAGQSYLSAAQTDAAWSSALGCPLDAEVHPWSADPRCEVHDCELGAYVACTVDGGHYLAFSHYNRRAATTIETITTALGNKAPDWFDPANCSPTPILDLDFEQTVLPFLQHVIGLK